MCSWAPVRARPAGPSPSRGATTRTRSTPRRTCRPWWRPGPERAGSEPAARRDLPDPGGAPGSGGLEERGRRRGGGGVGRYVGGAGEADPPGGVPAEPDRGDPGVAGGLEREGGQERDTEPGGHEGLGDHVVVGAVPDVGQEAV